MPDSVIQRSGEPTTPAAIVICADDYGAESASGSVIRDLLQAGRINATTCLVEAGTWPEEAAKLRTLTESRPGAAVGLHLNLTERLANTGPASPIAPIAGHIVRAFAPASPAYEAAVHAAFRAQWDAFVDAYGRPPDMIDGHEHVHLFPASRRALFRLIAETGFAGWLRQCRTSSARLGVKRLILDPLSARLRRAAEAGGIPTNPGFGGLRRFAPDEDMARQWRVDLAAMRAGGVLMVHPGAASADRAGQCRDQEARLIAGGLFGETLPQLGLALAADARRTWPALGHA